jgi:hypothetical protein
MRQFLTAAAALYAAAVAWLIASVPDMLEDARKPPSGPTVSRLERTARNLEGQVALMEETADRYAKWKTCVKWVPVNEVGDPDNRFGYAYDERDGTGRTFMPALAADPDVASPDYLFLKFMRRDGCHSQPTQPGGTAEDASLDTLDTALASSTGSRVRALERRVTRLQQRVEALERMAARFEEWESCLSWVPVTEYGDADNRFGYLYGDKGAEEPGYRPAIAVDGSEWDEPDYTFLAFAGRDRPFTARECEGKPGESVD